MAALTVTVAEVLPTGSGGTYTNGVAGETLTQGQTVYQTASASGTWSKAQCDGTAAEAGLYGVGFAMNAALAGQPVQVQLTGLFVVGATAAPTVGVMYCVGRAAGSIVPSTDLASTDKITDLGRAASSSTIDMASKRYTGYTVP